MAEPKFAAADDLPRTLRRERDAQREARERELRDREAQVAASPAAQAHQPYAYSDYGGGADGYASVNAIGVVNRFEVPFLHLVRFFLKAVLAAIPALILLTMLLFAGGQALKAFFPSFRHFEIVIRSPDAVVKVVEPIKVTPVSPVPTKK